jgi:hypothetical protein
MKGLVHTPSGASRRQLPLRKSVQCYNYTMKTQLYFYKPLMKKYQKDLSLVEIYYNKTKIHFENIEKEANDYANSVFKNYLVTENTDESSVAEFAIDKGHEMYESLLTMKSTHLLMTISMLYHIWEQQLLQFTKSELEHNIQFNDTSLAVKHIVAIFKEHNIELPNKKSWKTIQELKMLTNIIKHGEGVSSKKLRKIRPGFFNKKDIPTFFLLDNYSLNVSELDLYSYIAATKDFWNELPERAFAEIDKIIEIINKKP